MDIVRKNKTFLINTLSTDASIVLQHVQSDDIILQRDYNNLNQANYTGEKIIINLLDILMRRGDETCRQFLKVLEKKELQDNFPQLKKHFTPETSHERKDPAKATGEVNITHRMTSCPDDEYKMSSVPRGVCLIINNMDFGGMGDRDGSEKDEASLENMFKKLGFTVEVKRNRTAEQMKAILSTYSQKQHGGFDCFVCCILSHGTTNGVCGTDGNIVQGDNIYNMFNGTSCPSLINKPKVFFIQACRGEQFHPGVKVQADGHKEEEVGEEEEDLEIDGVQIIIPAEADFLVVRSTVKGYYSFRNPHDGSWFIQSLCEQLERGCLTGEDVCSILLRVNKDVSTKIGKHKQMPEHKVTLRKKLVFRVPQ